MFTEITLIDYRRPLAARAASRKVAGPYRWRPTQPMTGRGFYQARDGLRMDRAGSSFALRLELANAYLRGSRLAQITGYYCDPCGSDGGSLQPIIARLPRGRGFLAGWTMGEGMAASLDSHAWPTEQEAAFAAHATADRDAERSREDQEAEEEEREPEEGTHEFLFDVKLFASIRIRAESEAEARKKLAQTLDCASVVIEPLDGAHDFSDLQRFECSADGDADLSEIDGKAVDE